MVIRYFEINHSVIHVCTLINRSWKLFNFDLEFVLDFIKYLSVLLAGDERDGKTLSSESTSSSYSVKILIWLVWHMEIDDDVDLLNVDTSTVHICGYHNSVFGLLEVIVDLDSLFLLHVTVTCNTWESFLLDDILKFSRILGMAYEDNDLVELKSIQKFNEFHDLLVVFELDVVLLKTMKRKL